MGEMFNAATRLAGGGAGLSGSSGKLSSISPCLFRAVRIPLLVEKRISLLVVLPCCQRTWAEARVAWPHRSTSAFGVNQRRSKWSGCFTRKAVSERFISLATAWSQLSSFQEGRRQTAAGLPAKGRSV